MVNEKEIIELAEGDRVIKYKINLFYISKIDKETMDILENVGVPEYAAPYVTFFDQKKGGGEKASNYYDLSLYDNSPYIEEDELIKKKEKLDKCLVLGSIENDIFVLSYNGNILRIDYETLEEYYVNDTLDSFLESLIVYQKIINKVQDRFENMVDFSENITSDDINCLKNSLIKIDKNSLDGDNFWKCEIEDLEENISE